MINRAAGLTGLTLSVALSLGTAHGALAATFPLLHTHPKPLRGVVLQAGSRSLQIQTANDTVSVLLSRHSQILRVATGSLADLKIREIVTVNVTPGTSDVQQVVISPQMVSSHRPRGDHRRQGQKPPPMQPSDPGVYRNVHIVSLANNKMQVRDDRGDTATFPIDNNTKVTKILRGTWHDLAVGESVLVFQNSDGFAISVKILSG